MFILPPECIKWTKDISCIFWAKNPTDALCKVESEEKSSWLELEDQQVVQLGQWAKTQIKMSFEADQPD